MRPPPPNPTPLPLRRRGRRWFRTAAATGLTAALAVAGWLAYRYHGPHAAVEVYRGVTYACERLPTTSGEGGGLVHWVKADLTVPGVGLYLTPVSDDAVAHGGEYRLRYTSSVAAGEGLAVAVNGTLFRSDSTLIRRPGDLAWSGETVVADHAVNHVDPNSYLLWWDDADVAHLEAGKPPPADAVRRARWGIAGQQPLLLDGRINPFAGTTPDARTMVAADPARKIVYLACFDRASYRVAAEFLATRGATIGVMVDGGTSTTMALGPHPAGGVRGGTVTGNWRPVATVLGIRALGVK